MKKLMKLMRRSVVAAALFCGTAFSQQTPAGGAQPGPVTGLVPDHATISVENLEKEAEWYGRVLGFTIYSKSDTNPDFRNWHLIIPGYRIDMVKYKGSKRPPRVDPLYLQQGWTHVVFHVEDVAAALKTLQALQVDVKVNKDAGGIPIQLLIEDPEGNQIEIRRNLLV
jgi:catechol 2,3-dioxygenase-like lactoylglutathione lyase family enzyme